MPLVIIRRLGLTGIFFGLAGGMLLFFAQAAAPGLNAVGPVAVAIAQAAGDSDAAAAVAREIDPGARPSDRSRLGRADLSWPFFSFRRSGAR